MAIPIQVAFDAAEPERLGRFWATALGYKVEDPPDGFGSWPDFLRAQGVPEEELGAAFAVVDPDGAGPRLYFQRVPEGKTAKNRVHLDLDVGGRGTPLDQRRRRVAEAVDRLVDAGAAAAETVEENGGYWVVMRDPEGNEFCLH